MRPLLLLAALLVLAGCDVFGPGDTAVRVTGRVVEAATGDPIPGVAVFITQPSGLVVPLEEARTSSDGRFDIEHDDGEYPEFFAVYFNDSPRYNPSLSSFNGRVHKGETKDFGDVALERLNP